MTWDETLMDSRLRLYSTWIIFRAHWHQPYLLVVCEGPSCSSEEFFPPSIQGFLRFLTCFKIHENQHAWFILISFLGIYMIAPNEAHMWSKLQKDFWHLSCGDDLNFLSDIIVWCFLSPQDPGLFGGLNRRKRLTGCVVHPGGDGTGAWARTTLLATVFCFVSLTILCQPLETVVSKYPWW